MSSNLRQNFYVDRLKSFPSAKIAVDIIYKVRSLRKEGGFNLTKFSSNHIEVVKSTPDQCRKDGVKDKDSNLGILPEDKALGVKWNIRQDTLRFIIKMIDKPASRRGLLPIWFRSTIPVKRQINYSKTVQKQFKLG